MKFTQLITSILCTLGIAHAAPFELSADWGESTPLFTAGKDNPEGYDNKNHREPVIVKTNSGALILGVQSGSRLSWPERSGRDLAIRRSTDKGYFFAYSELVQLDDQSVNLFYEAAHYKEIRFIKLPITLLAKQ